MKLLASFIMRGPGQAVTVAVGASVLSLVIPLFGIVSGAVVALVTLRKGPRSGAFVLLSCLAFTAALAYVLQSNMLPNLAFLVMLFGMGWVLRDTRSLALSTAIPGVLGIAGVITVHLIVEDVSGWWLQIEWWQHMLGPMLESFIGPNGPWSGQITMEEALIGFSKVITGFIAAGISLNAVLGLYLARGWQAQLFNPGGFRSEFHELRLGKSAALGALGIIVLSMLPVGGLASVAIEIMAVLLSLYVVQGMAMIHAIVAIKKLNVAWLIGLYLVALFVLPQLMVLIAMMGLIDTWVDFRRRTASHQGA